MKKRKLLLLIPALALLCVLVYSLYQILRIRHEYRLQADAYAILDAYRPSAEAGSVKHPDDQSASASPDVPTETQGNQPEPLFVNQDIVRLRRDHPNAIGWISIPGTTVEFPFVQAEDNSYFLRRDIDGNYLYAGVPFLDYRCSPDCSDGNTIIYGHNLRNGSMFGPLESFREQAFFDEHREIVVYLESRTIHAEIAACLVVDPGQKEYLYDPAPEEEHLQKLLSDARCCVSKSFSDPVRFITLSTCGYEFNGARIVLVGVVNEG